MALALPLLVVAAVVVMRSGLLGPILLPPIGRALNLDIDAQHVVLDLSGRLSMRELVVRHRVITGEGGEILRASEATAQLDWARALAGPSAITAIVLDGPRLRLSIDRSTGSTNLLGLDLPDAPRGSGPLRLPSVTVRRGGIELGEHGLDEAGADQGYTRLRSIDVAGVLRPREDGTGYVVRFHEGVDDVEHAGEPALRGMIDDDGVSITLGGVRLDAWSPEQIPQGYRREIQDLDLEGEITGLTFDVPFEADPGEWFGVTVEASVQGVAMTLPIEKPVRLRDVTGTIKLGNRTIQVDVTGTALDVPVDVDITYDLSITDDDLIARSFNANIAVEGYRIGERPEFVPFLPDDVAKWLAKFTQAEVVGEAQDGTPVLAISPTGVISSNVNISRGERRPDEPAPPIQYQGTLSFDDGRGAFEEFPYPFEAMNGVVSFSDTEGITIRGISGRAPSGATLQVYGRVKPLGETAGVVLDIEVIGAPIDETLLTSVSPARRAFIERLFDREAYDDLIDRGLIRPENSPPGRAQEFDLGGLADLEIRLRRPVGIDTVWTRDITLVFDDAGILLADFPMPIVARDVRIKLDPLRAELLSGSYRPVSGFDGSLAGSVALRPTAQPQLKFHASGVPVDDLVLYAIEAPRAGDDGVREGRRAAAEVVRGLDVHGLLDLEGEIVSRDDASIGFEVRVELDGATFAPEPYRDRVPVLVHGTDGKLSINENELRLSASGEASAVTGDATIDLPVDLDVGLHMDWRSEPGRLKTAANIEARHLELSMPIEQAVAAFSGGITEVSDTVALIRDRADPSGRVDAVLTLDADGEPAQLTVTDLSGVQAGAFGGRLAIDDATGMVSVEGGAGVGVTAHGVSGVLTFDGAPVAPIGLDGRVGLGPGASGSADALVISLTGVSLESGFAQGAVAALGGSSAGAAYASIEPRGLADATVRVASEQGNPVVSSVLQPHWLGLTRHGASIRFDDVQGRVHADRSGLRLEGVRAANAGLGVVCDGTVTLDGAGGAFVDLRLDGRAEGLNAAARACLPEAVIAALDGMAFRAEDGIELEGGRLRLRPAEDAAGNPSFATRFSGRLRVATAAVDVGVALDQIDAVATIEVDQHPAQPGIGLSLELLGERARALGVWLLNPKLRLAGIGDEPGLFVVPFFAADCAHGRISGHAAVRPAAGTSSQPRLAYETSVRLADLKYDTLRREIEASRRGELEPPGPVASDASSARVQADVRLAGIIGEPDTMRGQGDIAAENGPLIRSGLLRPIIDLLNFQFPDFADSDDELQIRFAVDGRTVNITEMYLLSRRLSLIGTGTLDLPTLEIDLRLITRGKSPLPYVSRLLDSIRDELITTRVVGPLSGPRTSGGFIPEATRAVGGVLGFDVGESARALSQLQRIESRKFRFDEDRSEVRQRLLAPAEAPPPWAIDERSRGLIGY